jgi:hypothetical protein
MKEPITILGLTLFCCVLVMCLILKDCEHANYRHLYSASGNDVAKGNLIKQGDKFYKCKEVEIKE